MTVICALDLGNKVNGVVVVDHSDGFTVRYMKAIETTDLLDELTLKVIPILLPKDNTVILYENSYVFAKKNRVLMRLQKRIKSLFKDHGFVRMKALLPSQKWGISSGKNRDRKKSSVQCVREMFHGTTDLDEFDQLKPRNHDVADALLMVKYVIEKDDPILTTSPP